MSKYIDEIIDNIKEHPQMWKRFENNGLQKGNVTIRNCGNGHRFYLFWCTSIVDVTVSGRDGYNHLTWSDKYRLEETFLWWMRNASLEMLSK